MKNKVTVLPLVALAVASTIALAQGGVPNCDPNDPKCTIDNGCSGIKCIVGTYTVRLPKLADTTAAAQFAAHSK